MRLACRQADDERRHAETGAHVHERTKWTI
jgi:hypothetical protein